MHKQAIKHKQAIIGVGYLFTENACVFYHLMTNVHFSMCGKGALIVSHLTHMVFHVFLF